jgi:nucleoside-diphosphate-sugar epimerase
MGDVNRVLITGASGFIGKATVSAAKAIGIGVTAQGRAQVDLSARDATAKLQDAMVQCDTVIHLAAAMGGDADAHERVTINGTRAVLTAMQASGIGKLVLVSSMSVYALEGLAAGERLASHSPIDTPDTARDVYARAKLRQEALARDAGLASLTILRPGIVYSKDRLWNAHLGVAVGPVLLAFPRQTLLPMCEVGHLAQVIVECALTPSKIPRLVTDPDLPSRQEAIDMLKTKGWPRLVLPFPWAALRLATKVLAPMDSKLPGLLRRRVLEQRMFPMGRIAGPASAVPHPNEAH